MSTPIDKGNHIPSMDIGISFSSAHFMARAVLSSISNCIADTESGTDDLVLHRRQGASLLFGVECLVQCLSSLTSLLNKAPATSDCQQLLMCAVNVAQWISILSSPLVQFASKGILYDGFYENGKPRMRAWLNDGLGASNGLLYAMLTKKMLQVQPEHIRSILCCIQGLSLIIGATQRCNTGKSSRQTLDGETEGNNGIGDGTNTGTDEENDEFGDIDDAAFLALDLDQASSERNKMSVSSPVDSWNLPTTQETAMDTINDGVAKEIWQDLCRMLILLKVRKRFRTPRLYKSELFVLCSNLLVAVFSFFTIGHSLQRFSPPSRLQGLRLRMMQILVSFPGTACWC